MGKTLILSDIHFCKRGSTVKSVEQLRPLWQGFDSLILNGDTSELHSASHAEASKQAAADVKVATKRDGVKITFICGNHDPPLAILNIFGFIILKHLFFTAMRPSKALRLGVGVANTLPKIMKVKSKKLGMVLKNNLMPHEQLRRLQQPEHSSNIDLQHHTCSCSVFLLFIKLYDVGGNTLQQWRTGFTSTHQVQSSSLLGTRIMQEFGNVKE